MRKANIPIHSIKEYVSLLTKGGETLAQRYAMVQEHMEDIQKQMIHLQSALDLTQKKLTFYEKLLENPSMQNISYQEELIKQLTETASDIMKIPQDFFVTTIKELPDKNFGIGGKTIDKVKTEYLQTLSKH